MRILKRLQSFCSLFVIRAMLIGCLCAPAMVQAQLPGGVYTIDNRLPTAGRNYNSFNAANIAMLSGITGSVTFNVAAGSGPYNEQIFLTDQIGSSATKLVTFNCNGVTLRFNSTNNLARAGIKLDNADYVIFDNLVIEALATTNTEFGVGVHMCNDADHNIIRNCNIRVNINSSVPQNNEGIVINGAEDVATTQGPSLCDSNQIINNTISGGFTGVTMSSVPAGSQPPILMKGNQVLNNKISNYWHSGLYLFYNDGSLIQGNEITRSTALPNSYDVNGITLYEPNINMKIIGNRIHNLVSDPAESGTRTNGIAVGGAVANANSVNLIANNLIYDFQSAGDQYGIYADGGSYMNVYHNTISLENKSYVGSGITNGIYTDVFSSLTVMNNIITIGRTTTGSNHGFNMRSTIPFFNSDRNLFFVTGSTGTNAVGYSGGTQATLASWRTKTGKDLLSVNSDPVYSDPNNFVLIPTDKTIDNLGQYAGIQNDFAGAVRHNTHPDIGAYEFLTPTCVGPAVGGTTTMLPASPICEGSPMAMNLSGNSFGVGQTFQWQSSATINGTYNNSGTALAHPATNITAVSTLYYRVAVTCGTQVDYSVPVQVTVTPSLPAATYTINSAQATGGTNYQTFNDAINAIRCGIRGPVVFNVVNNGTPYREQVIIPKINGTSATNTVTFKGNGATLALATGTSAERALIKLNGAQYFIFDGLKVNPEASASGTYGVGFQLLNDADHNTIKNCTITMSTAVSLTDIVGITITGSATSYTSISAGSFCDSNVITNNTIVGGNYAITCVTNDLYPSNGNTITNNIIKDFRLHGIYIANTLNALVEGNDISRPTRTANFTTPTNAISVDRYNRNLRISKNKIHDLYQAAKTNTNQINGIFLGVMGGSLAEPVIVSNNLIYNFQSSGNQTGLFNSSGDYIQYYHNTVSLEDATGTSGSSIYTRAFNSTGTATNIILKNNIFVVRRGGTGTKHVIFASDAATTLVSDTNLIINSSTTGTRYLGRYQGTDYVTKNDWVTNTGQDTYSYNVSPAFANAAAADFTPTEITLDNKGTPVGITTDINNKTRRLTRPDIGAIEFKVCLLLGPNPVVRVDNETTTSVSFGWDAVTNATGYVVSTDGVNYVQPSSGTNGLTHTITGLIPGTDVSLYVAAMGTADDCDSAKSAKVTGHALCSTLGAAPVAKVDTATAGMVQFSWTATPNASGYKVSTDGVNFIIPSSGATGLTHTITTGLVPNSDISLTVQAQGLSELCPKQTSNRVTAHVPTVKFFVPNTFTPNRNGRNDYFTVQSYAISTMHLMIFNQWGQKIFETSSQAPGWDGTWNGKPQPVGVYIYALTMTMQDGTTVNKKGTINLIR